MRFVHYSKDPVLSLNRLFNVVNYTPSSDFSYPFKPNGLWFSDDDAEQNWKSWCLFEKYHTDSLENAYLASFDLEDIIIIRTVTGIRIFDRYYRDRTSIFSHIDWSKVAKDYKGIIISPYMWQARCDEFFWYYSWDVACACIWDMSAIKSFEKING